LKNRVQGRQWATGPVRISLFDRTLSSKELTMTEKTSVPRRRFLKKTAVAAGGAGALAAPMIATAQATSLRFQSTWPAKDIFHEFALDFAKKVNDMAGGRLKIEVLPAGAVVPAFQLLDASARARWTAGTAWSRIGTARIRRSRCGVRGPASAWTPTRCWHGITTGAARR